MESRRIEVFSSLLLLLLAVTVAIGYFQWWRYSKAIERIHIEDAKMVIGTDEKLAETVNELERTLKDRIEYQFDISFDPLDLTRVITSERLLKKLGADEVEAAKTRMRLAATIVGADGQSAIIIRYMGSNHILRVGDPIEGYKVTEIDRRHAVLVRGKERMILENEKSPESKGETMEGQYSVSPTVESESSGNY